MMPVRTKEMAMTADNPPVRAEKASMRNPESCQRGGCSRPIITTFRQEALCLDHFCSRSYEILHALDQHSQVHATARPAAAEQLQIADECARRTLDICMSKMLLNNLERARLLDILLWCGDVVSVKNVLSSRAELRGRYEKSNLRGQTSSPTAGDTDAQSPSPSVILGD
jgi:hypothetical protein